MSKHNIPEKDNAPIEKTESGDMIFWAPANMYQLANFKEEVRSQNDRIIQSEVSIRFNNHVFVTDNKAKQEFILGSDAYEAGEIRLCETMEDAQLLTLQQNQLKQVKELKMNTVDSQEIREKGDVAS